eukprot:1584213-Rhodomonas_salina.1
MRVGAGGDGAREPQAHPRHLYRTGPIRSCAMPACDLAYVITGADVACGAACALAKRCLVLT